MLGFECCSVTFFLPGQSVTLEKKSCLTDSSLASIGKRRPASLTMSYCRGEAVTPQGLRTLFRQCGDALEVGHQHCQPRSQGREMKEPGNEVARLHRGHLTAWAFCVHGVNISHVHASAKPGRVVGIVACDSLQERFESGMRSTDRILARHQSLVLYQHSMQHF